MASKSSIARSLANAKRKAAQEQERRSEEAKVKAGGTSTATQGILRDVEAGKAGALGQEFREGALGRLDVGRSADVKDIVARRRAGLEGLTSEESQALRERAGQGIQRGTQTALRQLRGIQGASGVRGGTAAAQQGRILAAGQQAGANVERDLFLQNIEARRQGLSAFEQTVGGVEQAEQGRELFNLEQRGRETFGRVSAGLGIASLGVAERTGKRAAQVAGSGGGGGKK